MGKTSVLRGNVIIKEASFSESLTNRILSIASDGTLTDRPAISATGFVSSTLPSAQIIVGSGANVATAVAMTGDVTISNAGVTAIGSGVIVNADVNASAAIDYSKLNLSGGIVNADVNATAAIAYSKLNLATSIVNNDVAVAAGIARSKTASGTAYRLVANNSLGVMSENAALTAARVIVSDANGQLVAATPTTTEVNRLSGVTANVQTQLDTKITGKATNALVQSPTAAEDGFAITWDDGAQEWALTDPVIQGIPVGGSTSQVLMKDSGTDYDASWTSLLTAHITDITSTAAELNILDGATLTVTELNYVDGVTSNIQTQLDSKLGTALAQNAMFIGNGSNVASQLSPGTSGYVLTSVGGVPTWQPAASGSASGADNEVQTSDGAGGFVASNLFVNETSASLTLGDSSLAGSSRTIGVDGSASDVSLSFTAKNNGSISVTTAGAVALSSTANFVAINATNSLEVTNSTALTNTASSVIKLIHQTSGTPATGIGTGLQFITETSASNNEIGATIEAVTTDVTGGSEDFDLVFKTMSAGAPASEKFRIKSTGEIVGNNIIKTSNNGYITFQSTGSDDSQDYIVDWVTSSVVNGGTLSQAVNIFLSTSFVELEDKSALVEYNVLLTKSDGSDNQIKRILVGYRKDGAADPVQTGSASEIFSVGNVTPTITFSIAGGNPQITINDNTSGGWKVKVWAKVSISN